MKNILISGGAGFIGSHLARKLVQDGYTVTVLDNLLPQIHGENPEESSPLFQSIHGKVDFIKGDVTVRKDWQESIKGQDIIVHLAAETGTGQSMYRVERYSGANMHGTAIMMDVLMNSQHNVKKLVLASSRAVYGEGKYFHPARGIVYPPQRNPESLHAGIFHVIHEDGTVLQPLRTSEDAPRQPASVYGITKSFQEDLIRNVAEASGLSYVFLRYQNVYGAGQSLLNPYTGILSVFSTQILSGKALNIFEDGKPARDFIYIDDVVDATTRAIESNNADNQIFNVGTGDAVSVLEVAEILNKIYPESVPIEVTGMFRRGDIRHNQADISKIKEMLGFKPKISFEEGIRRFAAWVNEQNISDNHFNRSLQELKERGLLSK